MLCRRFLSSGAAELVRQQARLRARLDQPPRVAGADVQGLWRKMLLRDDMRQVRESVTEGLLGALRSPSAEAGMLSGEALAAAVPQAVPRALRLVWQREQKWLALRRRGHRLPERVAQLHAREPKLARMLASFCARVDRPAAGVNPLFGEATLRAAVPTKRRAPPRDADAAYRRQLYAQAKDNLRFLISRAATRGGA